MFYGSNEWNGNMELLDIVKLKKDDEKHGVKESYQGTIVDVHGNGDVFTVEFFDDDGKTIDEALWTVYNEDDLELVTAFKDMAPPGGK